MPKPNQSQSRPNGLVVLNDFITPDEESELLGRIHPLMQGIKPRQDNNRSRVVRFGYNYFKAVEWLGDPPDWLYLDDNVSRVFESVTINEYQPGCVIAAHVDSTLFDNSILALGLLSDATMRFTRGDSVYDFDFLQRGLVNISDESRYKWVHEILPTPSLRYSIIYRHRLSTKA